MLKKLTLFGGVFFAAARVICDPASASESFDNGFGPYKRVSTGFKHVFAQSAPEEKFQAFGTSASGIAALEGLVEVCCREFSKHEFKTSAVAKVPDYTLDELELISGQDKANASVQACTLLKEMRLSTISGIVESAEKFSNPICEISALKTRQAQIQQLVNDPQLLARLRALLREIRKGEEAYWTILQETGRSFEKLASGDKSQLKKFDKADWTLSGKMASLYNNEHAINSALTFHTVKYIWMGVLAPISILVNKALAIKVLFKILGIDYSVSLQLKEDFRLAKEVLIDGKFRPIPGAPLEMDVSPLIRAGVGGFIGGLWAFSFVIGHLEFDKAVLTRVKSLFPVQEMLSKLNLMLKMSTELANTLPDNMNLQKAGIGQFLSQENDQQFRRVVKSLQSSTFSSGKSVFSNYGRIARTFIEFKEQEAKFCKLLKSIAEVDLVCAAAQLYLDRRATNAPFCFVQWVDSEKPYVCCKGMRNEQVDPNFAVANDFEIGVNSENRANSVLVFGANYAGKSVFIRGVNTALIFAQNLGICPSRAMVMTPFHIFDSYSRVEDATARNQSQFSAEVSRIRKMVNAMEEAKKRGLKVFCIGDELFTGTSPKYASSLYISLIERRFGVFDNVCCLMTTHFEPVIDYVKANPASGFKLYQVVTKNDPKTGEFLAPTYRVEPAEENYRVVDSAFTVATKVFGDSFRDVVARAAELKNLAEEHRRLEAQSWQKAIES